MPYIAPVKDMLFVMNELAGLSEVVSYPSYVEAGADGQSRSGDARVAGECA
jgi:hypothetical protein